MPAFPPQENRNRTFVGVIKPKRRHQQPLRAIRRVVEGTFLRRSQLWISPVIFRQRLVDDHAHSLGEEISSQTSDATARTAIYDCTVGEDDGVLTSSVGSSSTMESFTMYGFTDWQTENIKLESRGFKLTLHSSNTGVCLLVLCPSSATVHNVTEPLKKG